MGYDGFGNFSRFHNWVADKLALIKITASRMDAEFDNFATGMNQVILRSGVAAMTGDLKLGNNKITGIAAGSAAIPSVSYSGDVTSGMFFPATGLTGFSAAGVERVRIHGTGLSVTGRVGANKAIPRTALDVDGISTFKGAFEETLISATALTGTVQVNYNTGAVIMYTANAVGNWTFNIRGDAGATLDSILATNQMLTLAIEVPQGVTPFYCTAITIDGAAPAAIKWAGGGAPTAGFASGVDVYLIRVTKTGVATFQVRASLSQEK